MNAIVKTELPKRSLIADMANEYGMDPVAFQATLRATVVPANTSNEDFAAFLIVAKHYKLNPILKEIFAFPKRGGGISPIVSVDGWANLINSQPQCDGFEFIDALGEDGALISITCKIWRKDRKYPGCATEYMAECERATDTWKQWPRRMLRHKALIQAARYTFGFAGILEPDEAERTASDHYEGTPGAKKQPPPAPKALEQTQPITLEVPDAKKGEPVPAAGQSVEVVRHEESRTISQDQSVGAAEADYQDFKAEAYKELSECLNEPAVEEIRERIKKDLKVEDFADWLAACAERASVLFNAGKKKK